MFIEPVSRVNKLSTRLRAARPVHRTRHKPRTTHVAPLATVPAPGEDGTPQSMSPFTFHLILWIALPSAVAMFFCKWFGVLPL
ncbi:hypothetical protein Y882_02725 [Dyella japonica DSM 16301]|uniref:Uncharacterized protein n=1 Tax=Dyella japonica DSM 16301 TaxID=1440762 RepID=A0A0G9H866_9GAMM|nr:hypothetical protein Y882_02725 [Dyella japonica DSM 16301]